MEFHERPDWWLHHAVDSYLRAEFAATDEHVSTVWAHRMWFELLMWAAEEPVVWQEWW
jgi:hypothetical protein